METLSLFFITFSLIFVSELGDKSQATTFLAALTNQSKRWVVFGATSTALVTVSGITIFFVDLIPQTWLPLIIFVSGIGLIGYGLFVLSQVLPDQARPTERNLDLDLNYRTLFVRQFGLILLSELGDKTQLASFGVAVANPADKLVVFAAAAAALTTASGVAVIASGLIKASLGRTIQISGAVLLIAFGLSMVIS